MLRSMFRFTYRSFLHVLSLGFGRPTDPANAGVLHSRASHAKPAHRISAETRHKFAGLSPGDVDGAATAAGEFYRGIGVTVGLFSALVIFAALAPFAFEFAKDGELKDCVSLAKLVTMLLILGLVMYAKHRKLKDRWIETRLLAEELRYSALQKSLANTAATPADPAVIRRLRHEVLDVLEGPVRGQIPYNQDKVRRYHRMEASLKSLTYLGFAISLVGAAISALAFHTWLLLLTAFLPAAVAAMHGIAGFLRLSELVTQHQSMLTVLIYLREAVPDSDELTSQELQVLRRIAVDLLHRLRQGDTAWTGIATQSEVTPA
jgi:hypothetical protein